MAEARKKKPAEDKFVSKYLRDLPVKQERYSYVDGLQLRRANPEELAAYEANIAKQAANSNFGLDPSRYIAKGAKLNPYVDRLNAVGFVGERDPNTVWVDAMHPRPDYRENFARTQGLSALAQDMLQQQQEKATLSTLAHEMTHTKQFRQPAYMTMDPREHAMYEALARKYSQASELQNIPENYKNPLRGSGTDPYELGAYLSGYEATHPYATTKEGIRTLIPIERTQLGEQITPRSAMDKLKEMFGVEFVKDPLAAETMKRLMGQKLPSNKRKK